MYIFQPTKVEEIARIGWAHIFRNKRMEVASGSVGHGIGKKVDSKRMNRKITNGMHM